MLEYNIDEFIGEEATPTTYEEEVDKKVSLLYDFAKLGEMRGKRIIRADKREEAVRKLLKSYGSTILMDNAVREILIGDNTVDEILKRKGYLQ